MDDKFDGMYINYSVNKHDEWAEENQKKREAYKKGRFQLTRDSGNSNGNSGRGRSLTLSSKMQSTFCIDCEMSQAEITK